MYGSKAEPIDYYGPLMASFSHLAHLSLNDFRSKGSPRIRELVPRIVNPSLLKTLIITNTHDQDSLWGCMGAFVALETLVLPMNLTWDVVYSEESPLLTLLQHFIIEGDDVNVGAKVLMLAFSKEHDGLFENLTKIDIHCPPETYNRWHADEIKDMFDFSARAGMALTVTILENWQDRQLRSIPAEL